MRHLHLCFINMTQFQTLPDNVSPSHHCTTCLTEQRPEDRFEAKVWRVSDRAGETQRREGWEGEDSCLFVSTLKSESKCTLHCATGLADHCTPYRGEVDGYEQPRLKTRHGWATGV